MALPDFLNDVSFFNLRNGDALDINTVMVTTALEDKFHWPILGTNSNAAAAGDARVEQSLINSLSLETMVEMAYVRLNAGAAGEIVPALRRRAAIVLGCVRASMAANYRLTAADYNAREVIVVPDNATVPGAAAYHVVVDGNDVITHINPPEETRRVTRPIGVGVPRAFGVLTAIEKEMMGIFYRLGVGVLPMNGVALCDQPHIYTKAVAHIFDGMSRQVGLIGSAANPAVTEWLSAFSGDGMDNWKNLAFHHAPHPVSRTLMKAFALDKSMNPRLYAASLGSIAWRIPAQEGIARRIETFLTIVRLTGGSMGRAPTPMLALANASTHVTSRGHFVDLTGLSAACALNRLAMNADPDANARLAPAGVAVAGVAPVVMGFTARALNRRHRYAVACAEIEVDAAGEAVAYAYGFYRATTEATGVINCYRAAPSVVSLCEDWGTTVAAGIALHGERLRWTRLNPAVAIPVAPVIVVAGPIADPAVVAP